MYLFTPTFHSGSKTNVTEEEETCCNEIMEILINNNQIENQEQRRIQYSKDLSSPTQVKTLFLLQGKSRIQNQSETHVYLTTTK